MNTYYYMMTTTILSGILFWVWTARDGFNFFLKTMWFVVMIWGILLLTQGGAT